ncbi:putative tubulin polyglutamylase ttll2 [Kappamyces sp. JEL0829]|nr:putative tubulin polyglutamylase ttll2 [Kappamyces sp. JEL0829]
MSFCVYVGAALDADNRPNEYKKFLRQYQDDEDENRKLISGFKFDMRCYVVVRSYNPLLVYFYDEGLARFATEPYTNEILNNTYAHLTNTSINKHSPSLHLDKEVIGSGCKWKLDKLRVYLESNGIDFSRIWNNIKGQILLSLIPIAQDIPQSSDGCFELYGFDFLIDSHLKTWLLEINLSPALSVDCDIDLAVKKPLLNDIFLLIDLKGSDMQKKDVPVSRKKKPVIWMPSRCGGFERIFPSPQLLSPDSSLPKVGDSAMKNLVQSIKSVHQL